jgi:alpha-N-arabinofuranosidase
MDAMIRGVVATADAVAARTRSRRRLTLAFDEWNVWYQQHFPGEDALDYVPSRRLIEDDYTAVDAVVVGDLLMTLLNHADRVAIGCLAQLVNVIAPIRTEPGGPAWRQATFDPFALTSRHASGEVLQAAVRSPRHWTEKYGDVDAVAAAATYDEQSGEIVLMLVNRSPAAAIPITISLRGLPVDRVVEQLTLADDGTGKTNSATAQDCVRARVGEHLGVEDRTLGGTLPATSWSLLRLR